MIPPSSACRLREATMNKRIGLLTCAAVLLLLLAGACGGQDNPEQLLREARQAHEVEILSMTQHEGQVIISLRVTEEGSPLELPCLTLDALFLEEGPEGPEEIARRQLEADISELAEAGGSMELTWRVDIPETVSIAWEETPPEQQAIEIVLHQPSPEGLNALCEAKAIRGRTP
jgi:hypothetical protein